MAMNACFGVEMAAQPPATNTSECPVPNPDEWQCFGPPKLQKPEVFFAGGNQEYSVLQSDADATCSALGARVATLAELTAAQQQGADWCSTGWISDSQEAKYPITTSTMNGCGNGRTGIMTFTPQSGKAGVNCFGRKPAGGNVQPFNASAWFNPNSLPPGISPSSVVLAMDKNGVQCASDDGATCRIFPNEGECAKFVTANTPVTTSVSLGTLHQTTAAAIDSYIRGRE